MASSTRKSLAGSAAAAAKKVIGRRASTEAATAKKVAKKAPEAKKAPAAKKVAAKAPAAKKVAAKAPAAKKAPGKKAPGKKAPVSSLVVKEGEGSWTKAELNEVLEELHGQHDKLAHVIEDAELELAGLMKDAGDGAGHDQADMGATSFERDHELTVVNIERDMVAQIDKALARIEDGTYGICESCSQPIGKMRLMAFPRATLCLPCKQREERR